MSRLRATLGYALGALVLTGVSAVFVAGAAAELGLRALAWAFGDGDFDDGADLAGQGEDALDDGREW